MRNLDDDALAVVARYFGALAVPMRLRIMNCLRDGERNVSEITAQTGCTQANVSKHLALPARADLRSDARKRPHRVEPRRSHSRLPHENGRRWRRNRCGGR